MAKKTIHKWATADKAFAFLANKVSGGLELEMVDKDTQSESVIATDVATLDEIIKILQAVRPYMLAAESGKPPMARTSRVAAEEIDDESEDDLGDEEDDEDDDLDDEDSDDEFEEDDE